MTNAIAKNLIVEKESKYGETYRTHCLEIYKLYVDKADAISNRRQNANTFFLTINTALLGITGYIGTAKVMLSIAGVLLCYFWYRLVLSYKQLNSGKFKVVHEIEKLLPLSPYDAEWTALGEGQKPSLYRPFTDVEYRIPIVFMLVHIYFIILEYSTTILETLAVLIST
ncbi:MAG: hypothetical protein MRY49_02175 [Candidatus Pacebacteria bacterium]|nr:hypothetical protein [Candidatus Paceibacterota bacterium]